MVGRPNEGNTMYTYSELWGALSKIPTETLVQAADFFDRCPTGQYDEEAALALRAVVAQRIRDHAAVQRIRDAAAPE